MSSKLNSNLLSRVDPEDSRIEETLPKNNFQQKVQKKFREDEKYQTMYETQEPERSIELNFIDPKQSAVYIIETKDDSSIVISKNDQQVAEQMLIPITGDQEPETPYNVVNLKVKKRDSLVVPQKQAQSKTKKKKSKLKNVPFKWNTYKFLLSYPAKHWGLTIISNFLIIITSILGVYLPDLMGQLLDCTTKQKDQEKHTELSYRFLEILVILSILQFFRAFSNQIWQAHIYNDLRHDVLEQFLEFDMTFYRKYRGGEIISRMTNDLSSAKAAVSGNMIVVIRNSIVIIANIISLFILSYKLALAILVTLPLFTILTMFYSRLSKQYEKMGQQQQADITALSDEIVSGIVTVKSFCGEEIELKKFNQQLDNSMKLAYRKGLNNGLSTYEQFFYLDGNIDCAVVWWQVADGRLRKWSNSRVQIQYHLSQLTSFIFYSIQLTNAQSNLSDGYSKIISSTGAFQGVLDMLRYQPIVKDHPEALENINLSGQILFKNLYFEYPLTNVQVLQNLNFFIQKGEYVAFVGMSGCGKSTIVQLIERFYDPQSGSIYMDGTDIKEIKIQTLRRQIGLVSQEPTLFEGTLASNITYGVQNFTQQDLEWAVRASGSASFVYNKQLFPKGLDTFVGEKGFTLSGGQKQRIAIARALIKKPKILIFDEATSALDAESEYQVQTAIDDLIQQENNSITIIVIAHRLSTIVNCNKICVLQNGVMAECGTHQQLIEKNGVYNTLINRQMQGLIDHTGNSTEDKE